MNIEEERPVEDDSQSEAQSETQEEVTDPDDIDALLDSMNIEEVVSAKNDEPEEDDSQAEMTDPDDIDALLESMNKEAPDNSNETANTTDSEEVAEEKVVQEENDASQAVVSEADASKVDTSENRAKIENLTEEYVAPLLSADFSDILAKTSEEESTEPELTQVTEDSIDDDLLSEAFDEETLAELLNDTATEHAIELSPDFSDKNVLADLLNDNDENSDSQISEANEINDIQELDNLNFDELLANIEEESSVANQVANFNQISDENDGITLEDFDNFNPLASAATSSIEQDSNEEENFVSVDSLLFDSQDDISSDEPYKKANIEVGLNEFPEFTYDANPIDVDIDENGIAAKLDLAKVYLEIGDEDNAQVILKEIVKLGDPQQQAEAINLLSEL